MKNLKINPQRAKPTMTKSQTKSQTCFNCDNPQSNQCVTRRQPTYSLPWGPIPEHPEREHTGGYIQRSLSQGSLDGAAEVTQRSTRVRKVARSQPGDIYGSTESLPQVMHMYIRDSMYMYIVHIVHKKGSFDLYSHTYTVHMYLNHVFLPLCRLH